MKQKQKATITNALPMESTNFPHIIHNNTVTYNFVNWMTNIRLKLYNYFKYSFLE